MDRIGGMNNMSEREAPNPKPECPECGSDNIAGILWGMPAFDEELERDIEEGRIVLGGCCISEADPDWHCNDCGCEFGNNPAAYERWRTERDNKRKGVIFGAAVGDALGVPFEFKGRDSFDCTEMIGHGTYDVPKGTFSDDTSMLLATLDSIRECGGIDIDDITMVINFDAPRDAEDYVHRIGRTARAGREGRAITLVGERDMPALRAIESLLGEPVPRAELPEGMTAPEHGRSHSDKGEKGKEGRGRGRDGRGKKDKQGDKGRAGRSHGRHDRPRREKKSESPNASDSAANNSQSTEEQSQQPQGEGAKKKRTHRGGRRHRRGGKGNGEATPTQA